MKRNFAIVVKLSKEEKEKVRNKSKKIGMSLSGYLRFLALNAKPEGI